ncbi:MAG TPA: hypothetical protein PLD54_01465 [Candidatus Levybacteria bacterium]|nr:hypothetical protein [Candidatus Levybacteria bacterium]
MKKVGLSLIIGLPVFLLLSVSVFAASSKFLSEAQKYSNSICKQRVITSPNAMWCYTYEKVGELTASLDIANTQIGDLLEKTEQYDEDINELTDIISSQSAQIQELQNKIQESIPEPRYITFAQNRPQPFDSEWIDVQGYTSMDVNLSITGSIAEYSIHYTDNPNISGFTEQIRVTCERSVCLDQSMPILGKYYRISTGIATGNVTSLALLIP